MDVGDLISRLKHNHLFHFIFYKEPHNILWEGGKTHIPDDILCSEVAKFWVNTRSFTLVIEIEL